MLHLLFDFVIHSIINIGYVLVVNFMKIMTSEQYRIKMEEEQKRKEMVLSYSI